MISPIPTPDDGAPVDVDESFDEAVVTDGETDQVTHAQENQDEFDDPHENALNDPEESDVEQHVEKP